MHRHVLVPFLKSFVFWDVVKVVPTDDNTSLHLHPDYNSIQDATSDVNIAGEGALLVNVGTMLSLTWGFESKPDVSHKTLSFDLSSAKKDTFLVLKNKGLLAIQLIG